MRISGCLFLCTALMATPCFGFPLAFEERDARHFLARLPEGTAEIGLDRLTLRGVTLRFLGAASSARLEGLGSAAPSTYVRAGLVRTFPQFPDFGYRASIRGSTLFCMGTERTWNTICNCPAESPPIAFGFRWREVVTSQSMKMAI